MTQKFSYTRQNRTHSIRDNNTGNIVYTNQNMFTVFKHLTDLNADPVKLHHIYPEKSSDSYIGNSKYFPSIHKQNEFVSIINYHLDKGDKFQMIGIADGHWRQIESIDIQPLHIREYFWTGNVVLMFHRD